MLPYFRKAERQQRVADEFHGAEGPLHVQDVRDRRAAMDAFIDGMTELGIPRNDDFNGQEQAGCGYYQFNQLRGRRWSTATAYLGPARRRPNLDVMTGVLVRRVCFDGKAATGQGSHPGQRRDQLAAAPRAVRSRGRRAAAGARHRGRR